MQQRKKKIWLIGTFFLLAVLVIIVVVTVLTMGLVKPGEQTVAPEAVVEETVGPTETELQKLRGPLTRTFTIGSFSVSTPTTAAQVTVTATPTLTPQASPTPTITPSPTVVPTIEVTATPTSGPTATATPTASPTQEAVLPEIPEAGIVFPTITIVFLGIILALAAIVV